MIAPESFFHGLLGLLRHQWISTVKQVLKVALVPSIRKVHQLFDLVVKPVAQVAIVDPGDSADREAQNAQMLHLVDLEARFDQVNTTLIPLVLKFAFLEPDVSTGVQLCDQPLYVLFACLVDFLLCQLVLLFQVDEILLPLFQLLHNQIAFLLYV